MSKARKTAVLEHWFAIDKILFKDRDPKKSLSESDYDTYLTSKAAMLSNLYEMYTILNHESPRQYKAVSEMVGYASKMASSALKSAKTILEKENVGKMVKEEIKQKGLLENLTPSEVAHYVVTKRRNAIAIDSLIMNEALKEDHRGVMKDWQGKVLVDAHKVLREQLIDISMM